MGAILLLAPLFSPIQAQEAILPGSCSVTLAWTGSPSPAARGYLIHYGTASGQYSSSVNVGNVTSSTVQGLTGGTPYFFAVSCYNPYGLESPLSSEVSYVPGSSPVGNATAAGQAVLTVDGLPRQSDGFPGAQGTYRGLFAPIDSAREQTNSGSFLFSVTSRGSISGSFNLGG
ncbi:MAG: fibronectin type III domain-containing protein, partial [Verrucomicrobiota bacterium]